MPMLGPTMEGRDRVFQRLKPVCVALSQALLSLSRPNPDVQLIATKLDDLKNELSSITARSAALDEKLADYVFFPLSHVLKASQKVSIRCLELAFQCLAILIAQGWRSRIQSQLAAQVVILCSLMAEKQPKGLASAESTDDLQTAAFLCLYHLFSVIETATQTRIALTSEANFPQLGQTITTILDGILEGSSAESQIAATSALQMLVKHVDDRDVQAAFLPGITSKLTKVLTPQTKQRRNHAVLIGALETLCTLFENTLADTLPDRGKGPLVSLNGNKASSMIDGKWLEAAATQLKPALKTILRLKDHTRLDVREAVAQLCFVVLKHCRKNLQNCMAMSLETVLLVAANDEGDAIRFRIEALVNGDPDVLTLVQDTLQGWLQSLTTEMQAADDLLKVQRIHQINVAYGIVGSSGANTSSIDRLISNVLRDSVVVTIRSPISKQHTQPTISAVQSLDITMLDKTGKSVEFSQPLVQSRGQQQVLDALGALVGTVHSSAKSTAFFSTLSRSLRQSQGDVQVATFWLLSEAANLAVESKTGVDAFLNFDAIPSSILSNSLEDLYSLSLEVLGSTSEEPTDPHLVALALRAIALRARHAGEEFRFELIDALYPVLHSLATPVERLQRDSITALNIITEACGYSSVKTLIVENVDYLTNAVALKLNAFDVSPQAPQVLLMMVRLAGPSLLPYLEDTVDSVFAALEDYHGYPLLVELLFRVLSVIAEEGAKAPQLAITTGPSQELLQAGHQAQQPRSVSALAEFLKARATEESSSAPSTSGPRGSHPERPWSTSETAEDNEKVEDEALPPEDNDLPPPAPKTYGLLLRITELTQHFLPSASTSLRNSLLALIRTSMPAIARHENSFLPLINTLWPEITSRLDDQEPQVVASALDIIALLCEYAGDFMRSRILQLWPGLIDVYSNTTRDILHATMPSHPPSRSLGKQSLMAGGPNNGRFKQAISRMRSAPADYLDTSSRVIWTSLIAAVTAIVRHVRIPPEMYDEALDMLEPVLDDNHIRAGFEVENADAVWLVRARSGAIKIPAVPVSHQVPG